MGVHSFTHDGFDEEAVGLSVALQADADVCVVLRLYCSTSYGNKCGYGLKTRQREELGFRSKKHCLSKNHTGYQGHHTFLMCEIKRNKSAFIFIYFNWSFVVVLDSSDFI